MKAVTDANDCTVIKHDFIVRSLRTVAEYDARVLTGDEMRLHVVLKWERPIIEPK
jgi:hypothetical protein